MRNHEYLELKTDGLGMGEIQQPMMQQEDDVNGPEEQEHKIVADDEGYDVIMNLRKQKRIKYTLFYLLKRPKQKTRHPNNKTPRHHQHQSRESQEVTGEQERPETQQIITPKQQAEQSNKTSKLQNSIKDQPRRQPNRQGERERELGYFENSYIPENPRTPPISYIYQTVILFKKPTSGPFKTYLSVFETKT
ncbi:hypothetical protein LXL04_034442 [Taraxacum kok-saghyz]